MDRRGALPRERDAQTTWGLINPSRIARSPSIQHAEQVDKADLTVGIDVRRARWAAWAPVIQDGKHFLEVHHAIRDEVGDALAFVGHPIGVDTVSYTHLTLPTTMLV